MEHRTLAKREGAVVGVDDLGAGHVARQQVGRELDAVETAFDRAREFADGARLGEPGRAFDEEVPVAQQRHDQAPYQGMLADDAGLEPRDGRMDAVVQEVVNGFHVGSGPRGPAVVPGL